MDELVSALLANTAPPSQTSSWKSSDIQSSMSMLSNSSILTQHSSYHLNSLLDSENPANLCQGKTKRNDKQSIDNNFLPEQGIVRENTHKGLIIQNGLLQVRCTRPGCSNKPRPACSFLSKCNNSDFKSCHHCFTYYCSSECRLADWPHHKIVACPAGRAASCAKAVIRKLLKQEEIRKLASHLSMDGYRRLGRGSLVLWVPSCETADNFVKSLDNSHDLRLLNPAYVSMKTAKILVESVAPQALSTVIDACYKYDPNKHFVISVSVRTTLESQSNQPNTAAFRHKRPHAIKKCAILPICDSENSSINKYPKLTSASLLLTSLPQPQITDHKYHKRRRQQLYANAKLTVVNVLRQLEDYGVNLRANYPREYKQLMNYAEGKCDFTNSITIYPISQKTGKRLVVLIAPEEERNMTLNSFCNDNETNLGRNSIMSQLDALISVWDDFNEQDISYV